MISILIVIFIREDEAMGDVYATSPIRSIVHYLIIYFSIEVVASGISLLWVFLWQILGRVSFNIDQEISSDISHSII